jgi:hypothetical protein
MQGNSSVNPTKVDLAIWLGGPAEVNPIVLWPSITHTAHRARDS